MKKIFNAQQTKELDATTIEEQNITSIQLMERASLALFEALIKQLKKDSPVIVFAGNGNNGGDALALSRMLLAVGYKVDVYFIGESKKISSDCKQNRDVLNQLIEIKQIVSESQIPSLTACDQVIDGLLGIGSNRPIEGLLFKLIQTINKSEAKVYSIDMPSGLYAENNEGNDLHTVVQADVVLTIQYPKLALLLPQEEPILKQIQIIDIGLSEYKMQTLLSNYYFIDREDIKQRIKSRAVFSHKGTFGHALLIAGSYGKIGAALLAAKACLRTGVGLLTVHLPQKGVDILQTAIPEAMVSIDQNNEFVTNVSNIDLTKYTLGVGPAIGEENETKKMLFRLFETTNNPMVIDADALNLIASDDQLRKRIPDNSILTPHPTEFERLIGFKCKNSYERLLLAKEYANKNTVYMILKGAYSAIITPTGEVYFNPTGNPGMATGGSGDTLTGIVTSLLAQKYTPLDAAIVGTYLHGLAGDIASNKFSEQSMLPSDLIDSIGYAFLKLKG